MGICESKNDANKKQYYNSKELNPAQGKPQANPLKTIYQSDNEYYASRIREKRAGDAVKIPVIDIIKTIKSICKIIYKENNVTVQGTGFFMLINGIKYLITNYHNITENLINQNINIEIYTKNIFSMKLDTNEKHIQFYKKIDITIIEIKEYDDIIKDIDFLLYDRDYVDGYNQYKEMDIFTLEYPRDEIEVGSGKIKDILDNFEFKHNIHTEPGASGSPIILPNSLKVIGIHKEGDQFSSLNIGLFLGELFKKNKLIN